MLPTVKQIEEVRRAFGSATSCGRTVNALCDAGLERARAAHDSSSMSITEVSKAFAKERKAAAPTDPAPPHVVKFDSVVIHAEQPGYSGAHPFIPLSDFRKLRVRCEELLKRAQCAEAGFTEAVAHGRRLRQERDDARGAQSRAEQQAAGLQEDAERYRYIRDPGKRDYAIICEQSGNLFLKMTDALDAAIDAARSKDSDER